MHGFLRFGPGPRGNPLVSSKIKVTLNGKPAEIQGDMTLSALLEDMKIVPQMVACELNQKIVRRKEYSAIHIAEGDQIEILQMIGGG